MELNFSKMHGLGNDFILIDDRKQEVEKVRRYNDLAIEMCNRNFGVGADGLIVVLNSDSHDIKYRIFNPDGTEPEMCGNGIRCYAKFVYDKKIINKKEFKVETLAGTIIPKVNLGDDGLVDTVRVDMGEPKLNAKDIPFECDNEQAISEPLEGDDYSVNVTTVSMGNPHAVIFIDDVRDAPVDTLGPKIEIHKRFPAKTNVEFIQVISKNELDMRVWERGAGETLACGTGACASLVAARLNNLSEDKVLIHLLGGDLEIEWDKDSNHVFKTGPAVIVFEGKYML